MLLYVFISCQKRLLKSQERITTMMKELNIDDYVIVIGGDHENDYNEETHIMKINCCDFYEGLPEKVVKTYQYINNKFSKYTHIVKLDDDMIVKKAVDLSLLSDYCGVINRNPNSSRTWHLGKCSETNKWNTRPYNGIFVPYCLGGYSYFIAWKHLSIFNTTNNYDDDIYEDVYVGRMLLIHDIVPKTMPRIREFLASPDHK